MVDIISFYKFAHFLSTTGSMYMFYTPGSSFIYEKTKIPGECQSKRDPPVAK